MVIQEGGNQIKSWRNQTNWQANAGYSRERNQKAIRSRSGEEQSAVSNVCRLAPNPNIYSFTKFDTNESLFRE